MDSQHPPAEVRVDVDLVRGLLESQHPTFLSGDVVLVDEGWDNFTYPVGTEHAVRLPRRETAVQLLLNEQRWPPQISSWIEFVWGCSTVTSSDCSISWSTPNGGAKATAASWLLAWSRGARSGVRVVRVSRSRKTTAPRRGCRGSSVSGRRTTTGTVSVRLLRLQHRNGPQPSEGVTPDSVGVAHNQDRHLVGSQVVGEDETNVLGRDVLHALCVPF